MQSVTRANAASALSGDRQEAAVQLVGRIFDSMQQRKVRAGIVQEVVSPDEWRHRTTRDIEADLAYLEIHRPAILDALSDYLADSTLWTREIDWLFLNLLTYSEYVATVSETRIALLGVDGHAKGLHPPRDQHVSSLSSYASRPWWNFFAVAATARSLLVHPVMGVGVGALSFYSHWKRRKGLEKADALLTTMLRTYASFNTVDLSWSHVGRALEDARRQGVVWDAALFRLAEVRQGSV